MRTPGRDRLDRAALVARVLELQDADGRIRWIDGGLFDPWNHAESAMALAVAGEADAAKRALDHLAEIQGGDGAWRADMGCAAPLTEDGDRIRAEAPQVVDTNFAAYVATGVWHVALALDEPALMRRHAAMVGQALEFVLAHQRGDGAVVWRALDDEETVEDVDALLTGAASIYKSLECGVRLYDALGRPTGRWRAARARLGEAIRSDRTNLWATKSEFAMDWYYPVLAGALSLADSRARLAKDWRVFVDRTWGCRCVRHEPWATAAETAELAIALARVGADRLARRLLAALDAMRAPDGDVWMGWQTAENRPWPVERPSWTAGAVVLAYDAVERKSPAARVFLDVLPETADERRAARAAVRAAVG